MAKYTLKKMNMKKKMASLTLLDNYGNQQVEIADILGPKPSKTSSCTGV